MRAAIYSRKSVKSETGDSIENQAALCRQYIEQHWPQAEIEVYEDEGFSGATPVRSFRADGGGRPGGWICWYAIG
ncbi:MAG: recombinase family protein [Christensenellales bacterium]